MNPTTPLPSMARAARPAPARALAFAICIVLFAWAGPAPAQGPSPHQGGAPEAGRVPPLPPGSGRLVVDVVVKGSGAPVAGVDVALYALAPDGRPGLGSGTTDAEGRFVFESISSDPAITYLAGANFAGVPFGQRVAFEAGQSEQTVRVEVVPATADGADVVLGESRIQVGWLGRNLLFEVTHLLRNPGETVRLVPEAEREQRGPLFEARLPRDFVEFAEAVVGFADGLQRDGTDLRFYGPVYPGQQELRYRFTVAAPAGTGASTLLVTLPQPMGSGRLTLVLPKSGPRLVGGDVLDTGEVELEGVPHTLLELSPVPPGGRLELALEVPASRSDADAVHVPRVDYWLDQDDAVLTVQAQIQLEVAPGPHVQGTPEAPLLHIDLPPDAEIQGVSAATQALGAALSERGGIDVVGPIPAGSSSIEFGYKLAADADGGVDLDLRLDRPIGVVHVLIADNGIAVDSHRLHRRRPFRQGTRNYLHRRAFQLDAGEAVDVGLSPLDDQAAPRNRTLVAALALGGGAVWFLVAPLRGRRSEAAEDTDAAEEPTSREREMIYQAILDLDHDLETGKIDAADHAELRGRLRAQAIEIVRRERGETRDAADDAGSGADAAEGPEAGGTGAAPAAPGRFCPSCGGRTEPEWRFCSHCGGGLAAK